MLLMKRKRVGRQKKKFTRNRVELLAEPAWIEAVTREADRLGLSLSAYIRMAVSKEMERSGRLPEPPPTRKEK